MTGEEVVKLIAYIRAACPSQAFEEYTADAWAEILPRHYTLDECRAAVIAVKQRQPYVDVSDVITEARRARRARQDRQEIRTLLDPAAYRELVADADARTLRLIGAHRKKLAIEGPPRKRPVYIGKPAGRADPCVIAERQAAESRAIRQAREAAS